MAPKKNGFYFLMCDIQTQRNCTKAAAQKIADPIWKGMSDVEKQRYHEMAKKHNNDVKNDLSKKFTSLGVSFATIENELRSKTEELNLMVNNIKHQVQDLFLTHALRSHMFFIVHVNYYFRTEDNYYAPAEFAMSVFNFEKGLINTLHFFISLEKIPLGYSYAAKERTETVHKISSFDQPEYMMKDYKEMYTNIMAFIKKYSPHEMPPIFTMQDDFNLNYCHSAVQCFFETMCDAKKIDSGSVFKVYYLDQLFYEIIQNVRQNSIYLSTALMRAEIEKDAFSYAKNIGCFFHEDIDCTLNCSMSMVSRWIFTMCDHCCKHMEVPLRLGYHVPKEVDINWRKNNPEAEQFADAVGTFSPEAALAVLTFKEDNSVGSSTKDRTGESVRPPKKSYSNKIGANFNTVPNQSLASDPISSENDDDSDWQTVGKKHGMGRGRVGAASQPAPSLPTSGRGRLAGGRQD